MTGVAAPRTAIVCYEDREASLIGVKLLALSIARHSPTLPILIYTKPSLISDQFAGWLQRHAPKASLLEVSASAPGGWSIKPHVLIDALEHHCDVAIWLDADLMLNGPMEPRFADLPATTLSVAAEAGKANPRRAAVWGYNVIRPLALVPNSCIVRCTRDHMPLLREWARLTSDPLFLAAQAQPIAERDPALFGDQDLLEGLLVSDALSDRQVADVDFVRHDVEIIHGAKMSFRRCATVSRQLPLFLHAHALKPWNLPYIQWPRRRWLRYVAVELSPYVWLSRDYVRDVEDEKMSEWIRPQTFLGKCCDLLTASHPYMRMLPLQIIWRVQQRLGLT